LFLLQDASLEGLARDSGQAPNQLQIQCLEAERAAVAINQADEMILDAKREYGTFIRQVFAPAGCQLEMRRHFGELADEEAPAFAQIEKDRGLVEGSPETGESLPVESGTAAEPAEHGALPDLKDQHPDKELSKVVDEYLPDLLGVAGRCELDLCIVYLDDLIRVVVASVEEGRDAATSMFRGGLGVQTR